MDIITDSTQDPARDIRLDVSDTGGLEIKQEGAVKFIRFISHNTGTGEEAIQLVFTYLHKIEAMVISRNIHG